MLTEQQQGVLIQALVDIAGGFVPDYVAAFDDDGEFVPEGATTAIVALQGHARDALAAISPEPRHELSAAVDAVHARHKRLPIEWPGAKP